MTRAKDNQALAPLRSMFEQLANGLAACGFKRSRAGNYVNSSISRDWKWFLLGHTAAGQILRLEKTQPGHTGADTPAPTTGQILALERRANMTDDDALRFGRAVLFLAERLASEIAPAASAPQAHKSQLIDELLSAHAAWNASTVLGWTPAQVTSMENDVSERYRTAREAVFEAIACRRLRAPWPDFKGNPIYHGSRLRHPDGTSFVAMRLYGFTQDTDAWRAIYDGLEPPGVSRLCLQIGAEGLATIVPEEIQQ